MNFPTSEQLQANVSKFLLDGQEREAASIIVSSKVDYAYESDLNWDKYEAKIYLFSPRWGYDILKNKEHATSKSISHAFEAALPADGNITIFPKAEIVEVNSSWREELLRLLRGRDVDNQAVGGTSSIELWEELRFRSKSEIRIAQALDKMGVLFFPNCKARLNNPLGGRKNVEADFLICCDGKWGILEVDGEPFHAPTRTVYDHERDRFFKSHGISVIEHYDAGRCYKGADGVVKEFLKILAQSR